MRIHLVVNISWIVQYREQVGEQKGEEWEVEIKKIERSSKVLGVIERVYSKT